MFDVGFSELIVIGIVALVVIGPEQLPRVARTVGVLVGRLQRYVAQVKTDINREMELSELSKVKSEFESAALSLKNGVETKAAEVQNELREAQASVERELADKAAPAANDPAEAGPPPPSPQMELGIEDPPSRDKASG